MDWPVDHLVPRPPRKRVCVRGSVAALLGCGGQGRDFPRLWSADGVLPGPRCSEMESMPFRVGLDAEWLWEVVSCSLAIDSMTWDSMAKAWTRAGSACWQRDVSSTCLHIDLRTLRVWRVHIPKVSPPGPRDDLCATLPVFHALLATARAAIETFRSTCASFFTDTAMDYLPVAARMTWLRTQPCAWHIIRCRAGLKSWGTE